MKKIALLCLVKLIIIAITPLALAETDQFRQEELLERELERLNLSELEREIEQLNQESGEYLPEFKREDIINLFTQQGGQSRLESFFKGSLRYLFSEIISNSRLLGQLVVLAVIAAVLKNFQANFAQSEVSKLADTMIYFIFMIITLKSFQIAVQVGEEAINNMVDVMKAILPILLSLLISLGNVTSATLFHPLSFLLVNLLSTVVKNVLFPLIFLAAILDLVNNISPEFKVTGLASLLKQVSVATMGLITTVFAAVILAQGGIATVSDGVTIRTAKYLTGSFIPVVGGFISNALDMLIGGSLLIKNAVGFFGVAIVLLFCSFSLLKIIALAFIYRFAAAVIQPISEDKLVSSLNKLANNLLLIFGAVAIVGVMFFVVVLVMVATANFTVMLR